MPKKYQLLIDSPTHQKGMIATQQTDGAYQAHNPSAPEDQNFFFPAYIVENRPTVWQEIEEEPEKKIVERWRADTLKPYYVMGTAFEFYDGILSRRTNYHDGNYFRKRQVSELAHKRVKIMCRLMGLAETIEEGSTEMKGGYMLFAYGRGLSITHSDHTSIVSMRLATFSTKELAQLFLDSAGQDAIDWYGAVK